MSVENKGSIYDQWLYNNKPNFNLPGVEYFGKQFTFEEVDKMIDVYARAFKKLQQSGTKSVTICGPIIPSTIFAFSFNALESSFAVFFMILSHFVLCVNILDEKRRRDWKWKIFVI